MTVSLTCKGCGAAFVGRDEDELAAQLLAHITETHARGHKPTHDQVLAVVRKRLRSETNKRD